MKKLFRYITTWLYQSLWNRGFFLCALMTCLLCFTSTVYADSLNGKEYTVLEIIAGGEKFHFLSFSSFDILQMSVNPYVTLFLPVLSSVPFVSAFCAERNSGNIRFTIARSGKFGYCSTKFFTALLSGAAVIMLGFSLYSLMICIFFPNPEQMLSDYFKLLIGMGLYGFVSVLPAVLFSAFTANPYIICCFPFILMNLYFTIVSKIQDHLRETENINMLMKMDFLYPSILKDTLFQVNYGALIYHAVLVAAVFCGFSLLMNRRCDYGQ